MRRTAQGWGLRAFSWLMALGLMVQSRTAGAWLLHEHAATARLALARLAPEDRERFLAAWARARQASARLCEQPDSSGERLYDARGPGQWCVGFPVLTGLAADHSCSPEDTRNTVSSSFVLPVLQEAERVATELRQAVVAGDRQRQGDLWHLHHINLQIADPDYVSRAEESGAHFQASRQPAELLQAYLGRALADLAPTNAVALFLSYHAAAVGLAHQAAADCTYSGGAFTACTALDEGQRNELFAQAIATEAFAEHFLQDAFSSGHHTTLSGSRSARMGTHDHYCEHGVSATTWNGAEYLAHGDAFLDEREDAPRVAAALAISLTQFVRALTEPWTLPQRAEDLVRRAHFDACKELSVPGASLPLLQTSLVLPIREVPRPAAEPPGLASFTKELGIFYAPVFGAAVRYGLEDADGTAPDQFWSFHRLPGATYIGLGIGGTFEGVTDGSTDGVVSLGGALLLDTRPAGSKTGMRIGGSVTWHMPYYILPGDILYLAPFVYGVDLLTGGNRYFRMLLKSAGGGALGWQRKVSVGPGYHFQFVAGREGMLAFMPPPEDLDGKSKVFSFSGSPGYIKLALPFFALTTFHSSSDLLGLDLVWQLGYDMTYYLRDEPSPSQLREGDVFHGIFLGFSFRTRRYFYSL